MTTVERKESFIEGKNLKERDCENRLKEYLDLLKTNIKLDDTKISYSEALNSDFFDCELEITGKTLFKKICDSFYGYRKCTLSDEEEKYCVGFTLPKFGVFFNDGYDRTSDAFKLYMACYPDKINKEYMYQYGDTQNDSILISGDIDINLKMDKIHWLIDIVDNDKTTNIDKKNLKNLLFSYHELVYHPNNISIMPISGGMNIIKQNLGNDRIDTFLYTLKQYYEKDVTAYIFNAGKSNMPNAELIRNLKGYLDSFNKNGRGIYNYCKEIYHIEDEKFVDELCEFGKKAVRNAADVANYLKLVFKFWFWKNEYYKNADDNVKECYQNMVKEQVLIRGKTYINYYTGEIIK